MRSIDHQPCFPLFLFTNYLKESSTKITNTDQKEKIYTPPNCNSPSGGSLSEESLEMCTERLGSESGNDGGFEEEFALLSADENVQFMRPTKRIAEKETRNYKFPPPLTSISGGQNVHVKPHREGGRLVLEAVAVSSRHCFQADEEKVQEFVNCNFTSDGDETISLRDVVSRAVVDGDDC